MTQKLRAVQRPVFQLPDDIYAGRNVIRRHLVDFFSTRQGAALLAGGNELLAVFDCMVLDSKRNRYTNRTLHDYAILTGRQLCLWSRGRPDSWLRCYDWTDLKLEKYGWRSSLEGALRLSYQPAPPVMHRKINIRSSSSAEPSKAGPAGSGEPPLVFFLDLMPLPDLRTCAPMMKYLTGQSGNFTPAGFRANFKLELAASKANLTTLEPALAPFYYRQENGVYIETMPGEEIIAYRALSDYLQQTSQPAPRQANSGGKNRVEPVDAPVLLSALGKQILNDYSLSRIRQGHWGGLADLTESFSSFLNATSGLRGLLEVVSTDQEARQSLVYRLRVALNNEQGTDRRLIERVIRQVARPVVNRLSGGSNSNGSKRQRQIKVRTGE